MSSVNKVILVGRLGKDPETRYSADGAAISTLSVATEETWKDKAGEKQKKTEWSRVVCFGKLGELVGEYTQKGSLIYVEGKLSTRKWTDKQEQVRYSTEVIAERVQFLGGGSRDADRAEPAEREDDGTVGGPTGHAPARAAAPAKSLPGGLDELDDDIPF